MTQTPKKKRLLPKKIVEKSDAVVIEKLFGKAAKKELDRLVDAPKKSIKEV